MTRGHYGLPSAANALPKCPTGIDGLDEVTNGGLPLGRPTLVCGSPGCGKTLLAVEFLVRGAMLYDEPGVFMAFEETAADLAKNVRSLGFDLDHLVADGKLRLDYVSLEPNEIQETGEFDLEGLFVRLGHAIDAIGAKRVVLDTIETLFAGLSNATILRAEIRRLFRWLKDKGVTAIVTAERGDATLTRNGLEEYVSDCVILLDHRVTDQVSTRRLRIVKYRGSAHATNEFPFLIDDEGISVVPITSAVLDHPVTGEQVSTGVAALDAMFGGEGYFRGSSVLISGEPGSGKTSLVAQFADAACGRGERCAFFSFEESPEQILRNMRSIGLDLGRWRDQNLLHIHSVRPTRFGLEMHLASILKEVRRFRPDVVVVDPISNFLKASAMYETEAMLARLIDLIKSQKITGVFTNLVRGGNLARGGNEPEEEIGISPIIDTALTLSEVEHNGEWSGLLRIVKSRGMPHSRRSRIFRLTDHGIELPEEAAERPV